MTQRGYNLPEMMIALVVIALLIGGALVPLKQRFKQEEVEATAKLLEEAKAAIHAYALHHRTAGGRLLIQEAPPQRAPAVPVPEGRPYLPCPDIDGDGLEDRVAISTSRRITVNTTTDREGRTAGGHCQQTKGMLPWKTLGVRETDSWGSRFTYRVSEVFANSLHGFDTTFRADSNRVMGRQAFSAAPLVHLLGPIIDGSNAVQKNDAGAVICSELINSANNGCPNTDLSNIVAGVVSTERSFINARRVRPFQHTNGAAGTGIFPDGGLVDGVVFVVLSHGRDGHGAINRNNRCRPAPPETNNLAESANAFYRAGHPLVDNLGCAPSTNIRLSENLFVDMQPNELQNNDVNVPDDMLVWGGSSELFGFLARNGVFPVERLGWLPLSDQTRQELGDLRP